MWQRRTNFAHRSHRANGIRDLLRIRWFAVLFGAETQSLAGDQLGRVALSVLVFERTGSAPATAAAYAATLVPAIFGGVLLGRLGDRFPRRAVMIGCDVLRAGCYSAMAVPGEPLPLIVALVVLAALVGPVFSAAEVSYLAGALVPEDYRRATGLRLTASQAAQVGGFVAGGVVVALAGAAEALLINGLTFVVSAAVVALYVPATRQAPPSPASTAPRPRPHPVPEPAAFTGLFADRRLRALMILTLLVGLFMVPEGLAVPFGASVGASTTQIGLLLAAGAFGAAAGTVVLLRHHAQGGRERLAAAMATACGLPLVVPAFAPHWAVAMVCWAATGALSAYLVDVTTMLVQAIPDDRRARLSGVVGGLLVAAQGAGQIAFGACARFVSPATSIAWAGAAGSVLAALVWLGPIRSVCAASVRPPVRTPARHAAGS